jgi:hypothetical protein
MTLILKIIKKGVINKMGRNEYLRLLNEAAGCVPIFAVQEIAEEARLAERQGEIKSAQGIIYNAARRAYNSSVDGMVLSQSLGYEPDESELKELDSLAPYLDCTPEILRQRVRETLEEEDFRLQRNKPDKLDEILASTTVFGGFE